MAFTGGEPTVRSDLPDLVARARKLGYREISITTNARMLAVESVTEELLAAGLNRITFSLYSNSHLVHDAMSGVAGAHAQLIEGVRTARRVADRLGVELVLHSATLLVPDNLAGVAETVRLAASLGAVIHVMQPFIASRANLHLAFRYFVDYSAISAAVAQASCEAAHLGTKVKPYNIPICLLDTLEGIEIQEYSLSTHKCHQEGQGQKQAQFYRIERCFTCPTPCPGFRIEHRPRQEMVNEILASAAELRGRRLVVPGLDLLPGEQIFELLSRLSRSGREVWPMTGANAWCGHQEYAKAVSDAQVSRVVHLLRTRCEGEEGAEPELGNEREVLQLAGTLANAGISNVLLVALPDLAILPYSPAEVAELFDELAVAVPSTWRAAHDKQQVDRLLDRVGQAALHTAEVLNRVMPVRVITMDGMRVLGRTAAAWQKTLASRFPTDDWSGTLLRHPYTSREYNFVAWSNPFWFFP